MSTFLDEVSLLDVDARHKNMQSTENISSYCIRHYLSGDKTSMVMGSLCFFSMTKKKIHCLVLLGKKVRYPNFCNSNSLTFLFRAKFSKVLNLLLTLNMSKKANIFLTI